MVFLPDDQFVKSTFDSNVFLNQIQEVNLQDNQYFLELKKNQESITWNKTSYHKQ